MRTTIRPGGPKNPLLLGHIRAFRRDPLTFLSRVASQYGDICYFRLANQQVYLLNHPDYIRDVLVTHQSNFTKSRILQRAKVLLGEGLLTSEGALHLRQRRLVQPAFHRARMAAYADAMSAAAIHARENWRENTVIDVASEMAGMTLAIVGKTLFSVNVEDEAAEIGAALTTILKLFGMLLLPLSQYITRLPTPSGRRFQRARARLDETIYRIIAARRKDGRDQGDLLSMLLLAQDEDGAGMTDEQVRDEALTIFLAGHETTANALTWTWYLLSQNPECEARFHREVDTVLGGAAPTLDDFARLPYTEMIFAEAMRMYPPAWAISRLVKSECDIADWHIPAGAVCLMSPWVTQRDARFFPEPERFDPERWTPERRDGRPKFSYYPFGGGARQCIGERFAWTEGVLALAAIAQKWRLRLVPGHVVEPLPLVTLRTKHGMLMSAEARR